MLTGTSASFGDLTGASRVVPGFTAGEEIKSVLSAAASPRLSSRAGQRSFQAREPTGAAFLFPEERNSKGGTRQIVRPLESPSCSDLNNPVTCEEFRLGLHNPKAWPTGSERRQMKRLGVCISALRGTNYSWSGAVSRRGAAPWKKGKKLFRSHNSDVCWLP